MIVDLEMLVRLNITEFTRGRSVSGEVDVRPFGPSLRVTSRAVQAERTHGLHRFSCNKFVSSMWFLLQRTEYIIQTFLATQSPVSMQNTRKPYA